MRRLNGIGGVFALLLAATWGCGGGEPGGSAIVVDTLPNGAVHVRNPAEGAWEEGEAWRIVEELRIGSVDAEGPELFARVAGIVVDDHGRIHVLDGDAREIRLFDADGEYVRTYARSGSGPGELDRPIGMTLLGAEIRVADPGNARYAVFDTSGTYVEALPRRLGGYSIPWRGGFDDEGRFWEASITFEGDGPQTVIMTFDEEMSPRDTVSLPRFERESFTLENRQSRTSYSVPFAPELVYEVSPSGHLWIGHSADYRIAKATLAGDTLLLVEKEYDPIPVTDADRERVMESLESFIRQGGEVDESRIPSVKPAYTRLAGDADGGVWVERERADDPDAGTTFDVFDADGRYLGPVESPAILWPTPVFRGDRVYGTAYDSLGVTYVVRARIERGGE